MRFFSKKECRLSVDKGLFKEIGGHAPGGTREKTRSFTRNKSFADFVAARRKKEVNDGPTNGPTDGRTDIPSYRDARTHLKIEHALFTSKQKGAKHQGTLSTNHDRKKGRKYHRIRIIIN